MGQSNCMTVIQFACTLSGRMDSLILAVVAEAHEVLGKLLSAHAPVNDMDVSQPRVLHDPTLRQHSALVVGCAAIPEDLILPPFPGDSICCCCYKTPVSAVPCLKLQIYFILSVSNCDYNINWILIVSRTIYVMWSSIACSKLFILSA